jgi:hypothetical protein
MDHIVMLRIIVEECWNNKTNLLCCFINLRKYFDTILRTNLWNKLEEVKVPFELRVVAVRLYKNVTAMFRNTKGWLEEINSNIEFKQGCPLSPTLFVIYIDKLEDYLEDVGCVSLTLANIVIILLIYIYDIVLVARSPHELGNQIRILKDFFSSTSMTMHIDKMKVVIIKSKISPTILLYMKTISWRKFLPTNILESIFIASSIGTI